MRNWEAWPPLSLAHLAAFLEKDGHEVEIVDHNALLNRHRGAMSPTDAGTRGASRSKSAMILISSARARANSSFRNSPPVLHGRAYAGFIAATHLISGSV